MESEFECTINRWTSEVLRIAPAPAAALLPDSAEDTLGTRGVLQDAYQFFAHAARCGSQRGPRRGCALPLVVRSRVREHLASCQIEVVKRCRRYDRGEGDRVGATISPGLVKVLPTPPRPRVMPGATQTVVRRALVICECAPIIPYRRHHRRRCRVA
ncbi:hypothetical protein EDB87DRAFT_1298507 [Lactarius vividus]|nr:hypothetical protein EDB87DRAFT_1298507 [Lactarius vividus]